MCEISRRSGSLSLTTDLPQARGAHADAGCRSRYWKRCCAARWPVKQAKGDVTWKQLFFESYLQEKMEKAVPQTETEAELTAVVALCQKHARRLTLSQLQPPASSPPPAKEPEAPVVSQELGGTEMAADPEEPEVGTIVEVSQPLSVWLTAKHES